MAYNPTFTHDRRGKWPAEMNANITQVVGGSDAYVMEDEFNLMQWMLQEARADMVRKAVNSGVVDYNPTVNLNAHSQPIAGQIGVAGDPPGFFNYAQIGANTHVYVNGYQINLTGNGYGGRTDLTLDAPPVSNVTPSLPGSARDDLVFLESWFQEVSSSAGNADTSLYNYGGVASGTMTNDILDSRYNAETTRRVQLRWRIRVVDGVDFGTYSEGLNSNNGSSYNYAVQAQGGLSAPLNYNTSSNLNIWGFYSASTRSTTGAAGKNVRTDDQGLYIAGDGSSTAQSTLNTLDGYVYAIPLFRVRRRNSAAFDPDNNPLGGKPYYTVSITYNTFSAGQTGQTVTLGTGSSNVQVGDVLCFNGTPCFSVTAISGTTATVNVLIATLGPSTQTFTLRSDRPDGLYSNIIDASDIVDLRHQVSLTGFNYQALLEKNLDLLLRGQLTTSQTVRYARDYIGVNTANYKDDVNTLLFLNFDGSINGTANGATVNGTVSSGTASYSNGVQGESVSGAAAWWNVNMASANNTVEFAFKNNTPMAQIGSIGFLHGFASAGGTGNTSWYVWATASGIQFSIYDSSGTLIMTRQVSPSYVLTSSWNYVKMSWDGSTLTYQVNEYVGTAAYSTAVGTTASIALSANSMTDLVRISNVVRTTTPLPAQFSTANGDRILDGPDSDFAMWSDDVGGTSGVNGRTNPYGLTHVPNQVAGRISYNGNEVRHYYGQGLTMGWTSGSADTAKVPGCFDSSEESIDVLANEAPDGTNTTFTFSKPANQTGTIWFNGYGYEVLVGGGWQTASSLSVDSSGKVTAVLSSAPASTTSVKLRYFTSQRHAHFVPSTKGFVLHDWTDDTYTGNGSTTAYQTSKFNVTGINHVRVNGAIQNGGYSTYGQSMSTTMNASAASGATSITVNSCSGNVFSGQQLRISDGKGGWVTTTTTGGATVNGSVWTIPVTALPAAVSANAVIQGNAEVSFTTAPANGATVDIVYESVLTPSLGDYVRVMYQHVPYQGVFNGQSVKVMYNPNTMAITSYGTGKVMTGSYQSYPLPTSTQLPLGQSVVDSTLKQDSITFTTPLSTSSSNRVDKWYFTNLPVQPMSNSAADAGVKAGNTLSISGTGLRGANSLAQGYISVGATDLASGVPHLNVYALVVQDNSSQELYMLVATALNTNTLNDMFVTGYGAVGIDLFKIQGRPLIKGYAGIAA